MYSYYVIITMLDKPQLKILILKVTYCIFHLYLYLF